jgi:single-strand DNA-binding protein
MSSDNTMTIVGNLTADPELRFTGKGVAVVSFTIAQTPRVKEGNEWVDGQPLYLNCSMWREAAENVAESLARGARVIATGKLKQRSYETKDGSKRTVVEMEVDELGVSLRYAVARPQKAARGNAKAEQAYSPKVADSPWEHGTSEEPPF